MSGIIDLEDGIDYSEAYALHITQKAMKESMRKRAPAQSAAPFLPDFSQPSTAANPATAPSRKPAAGQLATQQVAGESRNLSTDLQIKTEATDAAARAYQYKYDGAPSQPKPRRDGAAGKHFERARERVDVPKPLKIMRKPAVPPKDVYRKPVAAVERPAHGRTDSSSTVRSAAPVHKTRENTGPSKFVDRMSTDSEPDSLKRPFLSKMRSEMETKESTDRRPSMSRRASNLSEKLADFFAPDRHEVWARTNEKLGRGEVSAGGSRRGSAASIVNAGKEMWSDFQAKQQAKQEAKKLERQREQALAEEAAEQKRHQDFKAKIGHPVPNNPETLALKEHVEFSKKLEKHMQEYDQGEWEAAQRDKARKARRAKRDAENAALEAEIKRLSEVKTHIIIANRTSNDTMFEDFMDPHAPKKEAQKADVVDPLPSLEETENDSGKSKARGHQKGKSIGKLFEKSKTAAGKMATTLSGVKRSNTGLSDMSFTDIGVTEMMDACSVCWTKPEGANYLSHGKCKNCK